MLTHPWNKELSNYTPTQCKTSTEYAFAIRNVA